MSKYGVFPGPFFPVFSPNTGKYGPEKTPYLGTFTQCELQESIEKLLQNELSVFKVKCEELVSTSYANSLVHIEKLEKEITGKDQIINHLLVSLENLTR